MATEIEIEVGTSGVYKEIYGYATYADFPYTGVSERIYIDKANNTLYRWDDSTVQGKYVKLSDTSSQYDKINGNV